VRQTLAGGQALWHRMQIVARQPHKLVQALITVADASAIKDKRIVINNHADKDSGVLTALQGQ